MDSGRSHRQRRRKGHPAPFPEPLIEGVDKPYGLYFQDITNGFTTTSRTGLQAFKVIPVIVYKVYADGRPDDLVRGVDIVGTPLASFADARFKKRPGCLETPKSDSLREDIENLATLRSLLRRPPGYGKSPIVRIPGRVMIVLLRGMSASIS